MIQVLWITLVVGIIVFFFAYIRIRNRFEIEKRHKFERILLIIAMLLLLLDIGLVILRRRDTAMEMNDCIRFYRYFPYFENDSEFYFISSKCYDYFTEEQIMNMRKSGMNIQNPTRRSRIINLPKNLSELNITVIH